MDKLTTDTLRKVDDTFYREHASSFSATRTSAWQGWERVIQHAKSQIEEGERVLDLACGNLRFMHYVRECFPHVSIPFVAVDSCAELVSEAEDLHFIEADIVGAVLGEHDNELSELDGLRCGLGVAFGFMHHVPTQQARRAVLELLANATRPGGMFAASFWQFAKSDKALERATVTTNEALKQYPELALDAGDYLLGWQNKPGAFRYCHSFSDAEIDELIDGISAKGRIIDSFSADGRTGSDNAYVMWERI